MFRLFGSVAFERPTTLLLALIGLRTVATPAASVVYDLNEKEKQY